MSARNASRATTAVDGDDPRIASSLDGGSKFSVPVNPPADKSACPTPQWLPRF